MEARNTAVVGRLGRDVHGAIHFHITNPLHRIMSFRFGDVRHLIAL